MKIYMIRHGKADYSYCDSHNFIGHGNDLAPLSENNISDVVNMSKDKRLKEASIIVSSPYTRALQTAAIISKEIGLDIKIEPDLREWEPDTSYMYKVKEMKEYYKEYVNKDGIHINGSEKWESKQHLKERIQSVIDKYNKYDCVIFVFHQLAIKSVVNVEKVKPSEIIECNINLKEGITMIKLYVVRRGKTAWNEKGLLQGSTDIELNDVGIKEANDLRIKLNLDKIDICLSSPLKRAKQTVQILIGNEIEIKYDDLLKERYFGLLEGKEINYDLIGQMWDYNIDNSEYNIESLKDCLIRANIFLEKIKENYNGKTILIVSHGAFIKCLHFAINGFDKNTDFLSFNPKNTTIYEYVIE